MGVGRACVQFGSDSKKGVLLIFGFGVFFVGRGMSQGLPPLFSLPCNSPKNSVCFLFKMNREQSTQVVVLLRYDVPSRSPESGPISAAANSRRRRFFKWGRQINFPSKPKEEGDRGPTFGAKEEEEEEEVIIGGGGGGGGGGRSGFSSPLPSKVQERRGTLSFWLRFWRMQQPRS